MSCAAASNRDAPSRARMIAGWIAVAIATTFSCLWAYWGILENFHEGWYYPSLAMNLTMMFGQYLSIPLLFLAVTLSAIRWPRAGGSLFVVAGASAGWHFRGANPSILLPFIVCPMVLLGALFWWGRPRPRRWALATAAGLPLLTLVIFGVEPAWRVPRRYNDGDLGARLVQGNGVRLVWAPAGPGWPTDGVGWKEATRRCRHLRADGLTLAETPQDVWRLPTAEELVRSLCRHGHDAGGSLDAVSNTAGYRIMPDKESPLWDVHSKVVYWWTSTEGGPDHALRVCYNGHVMRLPKKVGYGYLGFRAVKEPARDAATDSAP